tara:strand:+ start:416 stop:634 length:219 start_codon:yes stop_codon:yes gene_type:complete
MDNEKALKTLHQNLTKHFAELLSSGELSASELNVIRQFLKDNHIECDGAKNEKIMAIVDDLPFDIVDTQNAN